MISYSASHYIMNQPIAESTRSEYKSPVWGKMPILVYLLDKQEP